METFKEWVIRKYLGKDTSRGDLVYDISRDKTFPENDPERERILDHLHNQFACDKCIALFKRTWKDYCKEVGRPVHRKVRDGNTGMVYESVYDASRKSGRHVDSIVSMLCYGVQFYEGTKWEWAD